MYTVDPQLCRLSFGFKGVRKALRKLEDEDFPWLSHEVSSVSGVPIGEGRVLMSFVASDVPCGA